jgi:(p)ppGpp synthase/HD superfamily hydrolase
MSIVDKAKDFALRLHGTQDHGSLKIADHLEAVVGKLEQFLHETSNQSFRMNKDFIVSAGWLHDVLEDTPIRYEELEAIFGQHISDIVQGVTDGEGKNRQERHLNTYWRTRENPHSILVKMADRWHNQKRSLENKESFVTMYAREYIYFKFALYRPGMADVLWGELDQQYQNMMELNWHTRCNNKL